MDQPTMPHHVANEIARELFGEFGHAWFIPRCDGSCTYFIGLRIWKGPLHNDSTFIERSRGSTYEEAIQNARIVAAIPASDIAGENKE